MLQELIFQVNVNKIKFKIDFSVTLMLALKALVLKKIERFLREEEVIKVIEKKVSHKVFTLALKITEENLLLKYEIYHYEIMRNIVNQNIF